MLVGDPELSEDIPARSHGWREQAAAAARATTAGSGTPVEFLWQAVTCSRSLFPRDLTAPLSQPGKRQKREGMRARRFVPARHQERGGHPALPLTRSRFPPGGSGSGLDTAALQRGNDFGVCTPRKGLWQGSLWKGAV